MRRKLVPLIVVSLLVAGAIPVAAEPIPHERFDNAQLDLAVLKLLLNHTLNLTTESLWSCVREDTSSALAYSSQASLSLAAPSAIVQEMSEEVESYAFLVQFIPPFQNLVDDDAVFVPGFAGMMENLTELRGIAGGGVIPAEQYGSAMSLVSRISAFLAQYDHLLDLLENDANTIGALPEIPNEGTFDVTDLLAAIDALRHKKVELEFEVERLASKILEPTPELVLNANSSTLYLGQTLILSGYLIDRGVFVQNIEISILRNGSPFDVVSSGPTGRFAKQYPIRIDPSELGTFVFVASTTYGSALYESESVTVSIVRIPTRISISVRSAYEVGHDIFVNGTLRDVRGLPMPSQPVTTLLDSTEFDNVTDAQGRFMAVMPTTGLAFGTHHVSSIYAGNATHAPSSTSSYAVLLKYPAKLTIDLSSTRLDYGKDLRINGTFTNLSGEPIPDAAIRIVINGRLFGTVLTDDGGNYSFTVNTRDVGSGGPHTVYAEHDGVGTIWSPTRSPTKTFYVNPKGSSPGIIPGIIGRTGKLVGDIGEAIKDFFLGKTAPFAWALLILLLVIAYFIYKRVKEHLKRRRRHEEEAAKAVAIEPKIAKVTVRPLAHHGIEQRSIARTTLSSMVDSLLGSLRPREAVILAYARFIEFLGSERDIRLEQSMTHIEIQSELTYIGYPTDSLKVVTRTYEKAMYTVREVTHEDAVGFADALGTIEGYGRGAPT